jgi:hypothetical protein
MTLPIATTTSRDGRQRSASHHTAGQHPEGVDQPQAAREENDSGQCRNQ